MTATKDSATIAVLIEDNLCCGFGNCEQVCPSMFRLDPKSNRARLLRTPNVADAALLLQAAEECPTQAITVDVRKDSTDSVRP